MQLDPQILVSLVTVIGTGGAAWAGVKATLNGTVKKVDHISNKLDTHMRQTVEHREEVLQRLTAVETKIEGKLNGASK